MNQFSSIFGQILHVFSKREFYEAVRETKSEKGAKGFTSWGQFVAMFFCQLGQARSLREISGGLASCLGKLKHLGIEDTPSRSTLSYANEKRPWQLYQKVFYQLLAKCQAIAPGKKFRFKNKLFSLDASLIELCVSLFDWATYRRTKGAVKLHLLLDHDGYLPVFARITEGSVHEINIAKRSFLPEGFHRRCRPGLHRLQALCPVDQPRRLLRDEAEEESPVTRSSKEDLFPRTGTSAKTRSLPVQRVTHGPEELPSSLEKDRGVG